MKMDKLDNPVGTTLALMRRHPGVLLAMAAPEIAAYWFYTYANQMLFAAKPPTGFPPVFAEIDWRAQVLGLLFGLALWMVGSIVSGVQCVWFASALTEEQPIPIAGAWSTTVRALPALLAGSVLVYALNDGSTWLLSVAPAVHPAFLFCPQPWVGIITWVISLRLLFFAEEILLARRSLPSAFRVSWSLTRDRLLRILVYYLRLTFRLWPFLLLGILSYAGRIRWDTTAGLAAPEQVDGIDIALMAAGALAMGVFGIGVIGLSTLLWFKFQNPAASPSAPRSSSGG
jgi:hypothetical protein